MSHIGDGTAFISYFTNTLNNLRPGAFWFEHVGLKIAFDELSPEQQINVGQHLLNVNEFIQGEGKGNALAANTFGVNFAQTNRLATQKSWLPTLIGKLGIRSHLLGIGVTLVGLGAYFATHNPFKTDAS